MKWGYPQNALLLQAASCSTTQDQDGCELDIQHRIRNFRSGLTANLLLAIFNLLYILATPDGPHRSLLALLTVTFLAALILLAAFPARRIATFSYRAPFFHSWTLICLFATFIIVWLDGGVDSPAVLYLYMIMLFSCQTYAVLSSAFFALIGLAGYVIVAVNQPLEPGLNIERLFTLSLLALAYGFSTLIAYNRAAQAQDNSQLRQELAHSAIHDVVTDCPNRRYFLQRLEHEFARACRVQSTLSLLLVDVDRFKTINDQHGHSQGDELLRNIAGMLNNETRRADTLARLGGDEFVLLAPDTSAAEASALAERLRQQIATLPPPCKVTLSIGICTATNPTAYCAEDLLECADQALYAAKRAGRDSVKTRDIASMAN